MELPSNCTVYLMVPPEASIQSAAWGLPVAHFAYRVGPGPHLFRTDLRYPAKGGILVADIGDYTGGGNGDALAREIEQECAAKGFQGAFLDFDGTPIPALQRAIEVLSAAFQRQNKVLYVPEAYFTPAFAAKVVISSAISGGTLLQRLGEVVETYGAERVALGIEWSAMDFTLPASAGDGVALSHSQLQSLRARRGSATYFSDELCAHYFTYMNTGGDAHFVLFDDPASVLKKLKVAVSLGISAAFLPIPEEKSYLEELLASNAESNFSARR